MILSTRRKYPLQLFAWHTRRRCHSVHDNNEWMDEVERPAVWIHPDDAKDRGIGDGDTVEIFNRRGIIRMPAHVTDRIMKGVLVASFARMHQTAPEIKAMYEQFTGADRQFNPMSGTEICPAKAFAPRLEDNLLTVNVVDGADRTDTVRVALRCAR